MKRLSATQKIYAYVDDPTPQGGWFSRNPRVSRPAKDLVRVHIPRARRDR